MLGTVKWYNDSKAYGFVAPDSGGQDVFVHVSALQKARIQTLEESDRISFDEEPSKNGKTNAVNIALISGAKTARG